MARKEFEFVKDYPQGGHKIGDRLKFDNVPFHLKDFLTEVSDVHSTIESVANAGAVDIVEDEGLIKPKPTEKEKKERIKKANSNKSTSPKKKQKS